MSEDLTDLDDTALVRAAGSGDMDALGVLYSRHYRLVYEIYSRMVRDPDIAEDLTHEGFLRVRRYGSSFDGRSSVGSWLYRLARNRCLDYWAAREREEAKERAWRADAPTQVEPDVESDRQAIVRQALARLEPELREVLVLSRFAGMKYREIAESCGLSLANVKVRAHRAMRALQAALEELGYENEP